MSNTTYENDLIEAVENDEIVRTKQLIAAGANVTVTNEDEMPLLLIAIKNGGSKEMAELLLDAGADIGWKTPEGVSLLDEAVERNRIDLAELLIDRGLDPAVTSRKSGMTVLMLAACFDYIAMMEMLLEKGADLYAVDALGMGAADYARKLGCKTAFRWLEERMADSFKGACD
jgi:ankyrin repeat protein